MEWSTQVKDDMEWNTQVKDDMEWNTQVKDNMARSVRATRQANATSEMHLQTTKLSMLLFLDDLGFAKKTSGNRSLSCTKQTHGVKLLRFKYNVWRFDCSIHNEKGPQV